MNFQNQDRITQEGMIILPEVVYPLCWLPEELIKTVFSKIATDMVEKDKHLAS